MYMLEDHTMDWVKARSVGFGLLGEQGAESIHSKFNTLGRNFSSVPKGEERLRNIMRAHHVSVVPQNVAARPPPAKRKKMQLQLEE